MLVTPCLHIRNLFVCSYLIKTLVLVSLQNDNNKEVIYNVKEGVNHTCVTLSAVGAIIQTAFDVTVVAKDGSAICGCLLYVYIYNVSKFNGTLHD